MKRSTTVVWKGSGKDGSGTITTQSKTLNNAHYAWNTRFEDSKGTNPEELIAAAHAACFTMKLSFLLVAAGHTPDTIETVAEVTLEKDAISQSRLQVQAVVPGISQDKFMECANNAKDNCIVSRVLNAEISMEANLTEKVMS